MRIVTRGFASLTPVADAQPPESTATPKTSPEQRKEFVHVQHLRAVAALMVVFQHSQFLYQKSWGGVFGGIGVDLFFAISGFVIFASTMGTFSLREYLLKRCIRIIPIYWALTVLMAILILGAPSLFSATIFRYDHFVQSLLFIPTYSPSRPNEITPLLPPGWTLNYEMYFYLVFGILLFLLRSRTALLAVIACLFCALVYCGAILQPKNAMVLTYTSPKLLEFLAGVVAAYVLLYYPRNLPSLGINLLLMALGWAFLLFVGIVDQSYPLLLVPAVFLIVYATAALDRLGAVRPHAFLKLLGDASYSIYLVHVFVLGTVKQVFIRLITVSDSSHQALAFVLTCLVLTACAGVLLYLCFEIPVMNCLRRKLLPLARPINH
jgi:exopolysaccharide production protein ExoZ